MSQVPPPQGATVIIGRPEVPPTPFTTRCPNCHQEIVTAVTFVNGTMVWICVGVLLLFGCWLGCCLIPLCIDDLKDVEHHCPQCNAYIGTRKRL